jgi:hypothetical protein
MIPRLGPWAEFGFISRAHWEHGIDYLEYILGVDGASWVCTCHQRQLGAAIIKLPLWPFRISACHSSQGEERSGTSSTV